MSKKKKVIIASLTALFAVIFSGLVVTYSLAGGGASKKEKAAAAGSTMDLSFADDVAAQLTNIDHIIEKANAGEKFYVVQIVSDGNEDTSLKTYIDNEDFAEHVLNRNRSEGFTQTMPAGKIELDVVTVAEMNAMVAAQDYSILNKADLIYINNSASKSYMSGNDIPDQLYSVLKAYFDSDYKPLIIDAPSDAIGGGTGGGGAAAAAAYSMQRLASKILASNYIKYRTYPWDTEASPNILRYMGMDDPNTLFFPMTLKMTDEEQEANKAANGGVLTRNWLCIYDDTDSKTMYNAIGGANASPDVIAAAYYKKKAVVPDAVKVDRISYTDATNSADIIAKYDFVFIEPGTYANMSTDIYNSIAAVSYAKVNMVYAKKLEKKDGAPDTPAENTSTKGTNYRKLYDIAATKDGISKYDNVMVTSNSFFDLMAEKPNDTQAAADEVAELLNNSTYREFGKNSGGASTVFTVLEIQPAYPVDKEMAEANEIYYTDPANVYKCSKEMAPAGAEYYDFELTKEKVIALTGLSDSEIKVVQMSTEELQGTKDSILGTYDLIYIGGNVSALNDASQYRIRTDSSNGQVGKFNGATFFQMYSHTGQVQTKGDGMMYVNNFYGSGGENGIHFNAGGNDITYKNLNNLKSYVKAGMPIIISDDLTAAYTGLASYTDNLYKNRFIDPDSNMFKLLAYIFEDKDADKAGVTYTYTNSKNRKNVLANFDKDNVIRVSNLDKHYGASLVPYVEIFDDGVSVPDYVLDANGKWQEYDGETNPAAGDATKVAATAGNQINKLMNTAAKRPKLIVTSCPQRYKMKTPDTYLKEPKLNFEFEVSANGNAGITGYTVRLLIDQNSDGIFSYNEDELVYTKAFTGSSFKHNFTAKMKDDFYGPVNWKLEIESKPDGIMMSFSDISYVKRRDKQPKELVSVLQIIPSTTGTSNHQGNENLYFCTDCQATAKILEKNPYPNTKIEDPDFTFPNEAKIREEIMNDPNNAGLTEAQINNMVQTKYNAMYTTWKTNVNNLYQTFEEPAQWFSAPPNTNIKSEYSGLGLHDHRFGIWRYMEELKYDDWTSNLADDITGEDGDFEIKIDLVSPDMLKQYVADINSTKLYKLQQDYTKLAIKKATFKSKLDAAQTTLDTLNAELDALKKNGSEGSIGTKEAEVACQEARVKELKALVSLVNKNYSEPGREPSVDFCEEILQERKVALDKEVADLQAKFDKLVAENASTDAQAAANLKVEVAQAALETIMDLYQPLIDARVDIDKEQNALLDAAEQYKVDKNYDALVEAEEKAEADLRKALKYFIDNEATLKNNPTITANIKHYNIFEKMYNDRMYYEIYTDTYSDLRYNDYIYRDGILDACFGYRTSYNALYGAWANARSARVLVDKEYNKKLRQAYGKDWMYQLYSCVILGAAENFSEIDIKDQPSLDYIVDFEEREGNLILFHDAMAKDSAKDAVKLTAALRERLGVDRFHMKADGDVFKLLDASESELGIDYTKLDKKYFMTAISYNDPGKNAKKAKIELPWSSNGSAWFDVDRSASGIATPFVIFRTNIFGSNMSAMTRLNFDSPYTSLPYRYASLEMNTMAFNWNRDAIKYISVMEEGSFGTTSAVQLNRCIVTAYPFNVAETLEISATHSQVFELDVEDDEVIPLYTLSASHTLHAGSSYYAADPKDACDNYFIYSKDNATYCGAGHSKVTGPMTNNNDERMLFINIICRKTGKGPIEFEDDVTPDILITIYDPDTELAVPNEENKYIKTKGASVKGEEYTDLPYIDVASADEKIRLGFGVTMDEETGPIENIKMYFVYTDDDGEEQTEEVRQYPTEDGTKECFYDNVYFLDSNRPDAHDDSIPLKEKYFDEDNYAYLYIEVTVGDVKEKKLIRIERADKMFDLT